MPLRAAIGNSLIRGDEHEEWGRQRRAEPARGCRVTAAAVIGAAADLVRSI